MTSAAERRAERVRRAASLGGAAVLRAYDESALLEEACRILVEQADVAVAWIGEAEPGPGQRVRVLAIATPDGRDPPTVQLGWSGRGDQRHPAVRAIREQRPQLARFRADPDAQPGAGAGEPASTPRLSPTIATEAEALSLAAMAAFPLQFPPHGLGVLCVGSLDTDAFTHKEMTSLRELASDIAVGIATLREKQARDRLEHELESAQSRYRGLIENAPEGILETTLAGAIRLANRALARLMGYATPEELLARSPRLDEHMDAKDHERFLGAVRSGGPWPIEVRLHRADGSQVWASLNATIVHGADGPAVECFVQDLTAARARRAAAARLAAIVDATEEAIMALDLDGRVEAWNRGAEGLYGYTAEEALGRLVQELVVPDDRMEEAMAVLERVRAGERVPHFETTRRRKGGSLVEVSVSANPVLGADGEVTGVAVTQHDITQRKRGEAARRVLERQEAEVTRLSELERMRSAFLSEASHEINTPLTTIRLQLDVLKMMPSIDERERACLNIIEGSVQRMARLVKDMLEASSLRSGRLKLQRQPTDMAKTIEDAVVTFNEFGRRASVTLQALPMKRFYVDADPTRAMQVLFNLLSNAVKFTPKGGRVVVSTSVADGMATVCVKDEGLGMTQEQLDALFVPFGRLHEHVPGIALGTGLGLFISKGIVEQHGGKLWATSDGPGKGSSFCFTLPLAPPPKDLDGPLGASRPAVVRKRRPDEPARAPAVHGADAAEPEGASSS